MSEHEHADHLDESRAMFLVALHEDDAERRAVQAHIEQCERCRALWQESLQLVALLDREALETDAAPLSDAFVQRVQAAVLGAQVASSPWFKRVSVWGFLLGALCSLGLFWTQLYAQPQPGLQLHEPHLGWGCLRFELGLGAGAFVLGLFGSRAVARALGPSGAALAAMSGALVGQWLLRSRCESEQTALHLLLFHVAGIALAALLGALAGELQASRARA